MAVYTIEIVNPATMSIDCGSVVDSTSNICDYCYKRPSSAVVCDPNADLGRAELCDTCANRHCAMHGSHGQMYVPQRQTLSCFVCYGCSGMRDCEGLCGTMIRASFSIKFCEGCEVKRARFDENGQYYVEEVDDEEIKRCGKRSFAPGKVTLGDYLAEPSIKRAKAY